MKTYTPDELKAILAKHLKYVLGVDGGERANLSGADLSWKNRHYQRIRHWIRTPYDYLLGTGGQSMVRLFYGDAYGI